MRTNRTAILALLGGLAPLAAAAQVIELDEITATASLEDVATARSGASVIVVTEDELDATAETRVTDLLATLPGVNISSTGPLGTRTGITLRGASQNYVTVLIDGIEVTDPSITQVSFDFGSLTTADISRIEVLKGSQSALYGSEAIGGVIAITTRRATAPGTEQSVDLEYGSYESLRASYGLATMGERHELAFTLSHVETDGYSAADEDQGNTEADGFSADRLSLYGHYDLQSGARIGFSGFVEASEGDFDEFAGPGGDGTPGDEYNDNDSWGARAFTEFTTGAFDHQLDATYTESHRESFFNGFPSVFDGTRTKVGYLGATDLGADTRLAFGTDWTEETARDNFGFSGDDQVLGLFTEATWSPGEQLDVTAALRHDDHSQFGGHTTGRLAAAWRPREDLTLRGSVGTGFRAPSLYELFSAFGDPTLTPEQSLSADLGVERRFANGAYLRATGFYLEVEDLIDFDFAATACGSGFGCYAQVPGLSRRSGLELEGGVALGERVELGASYTYTDSATSASSSWAAVPRHDVSVSVTAALTDALSAALTAQYAADRQNGLPDYGVIHATTTYALNDSTEAYLRIENLLDNAYQTTAGYGTSDRAFFVGLRKSF